MWHLCGWERPLLMETNNINMTQRKCISFWLNSLTTMISLIPNNVFSGKSGALVCIKPYHSGSLEKACVKYKRRTENENHLSRKSLQWWVIIPLLFPARATIHRKLPAFSTYKKFCREKREVLFSNQWTQNVVKGKFHRKLLISLFSVWIYIYFSGAYCPH